MPLIARNRFKSLQNIVASRQNKAQIFISEKFNGQQFFLRLLRAGERIRVYGDVIYLAELHFLKLSKRQLYWKGISEIVTAFLVYFERQTEKKSDFNENIFKKVNRNIIIITVNPAPSQRKKKFNTPACSQESRDTHP